MTRIGIVIGLASCLASIAACAPSKEATPMAAFKKRVSATIFLIGPDVDNCKAKVSPFRMQPKNNELADWTVIDLCANVTKNYTETVTLTFSPITAGACDGEQIFPGNRVSGTANFQGAVNNKCKVDEQFTYTVTVSGKTLVDPELEIGQ